jgi:hypothetical protein
MTPDPMTPDQDKDNSTTHRRDRPREQCAECRATLVADQRYCLQCGARRGKPRVDFTAFWAPLSPTGAQPEQGDPSPARAADYRSWLDRGAPSRRAAAALVASVLAAGIFAGAALGPGPASSPADDSTLAQRALAALVAQASDSSQPSAATSSIETSRESANTTTPATTSAPSHKAKAASKSQASALASPESSSSSQPSAGTPSSEGSSSEGSGESKGAVPGAPVKLPPIKHVWLIALSGESIDAAAASPTTDPYLVKRLAPKGTLLSGYTLSASSALANGIALLSGQGVNLDTEQNCPGYVGLQPPTVSATNGLAEGVGCVYPAAVKTLADELTAAGLTWKAYVQGMEDEQGSGASGAPAPASETPSAAPTSTTQSSGSTSQSPGSTSVTQSSESTSTVPSAGSPAQPSASAVSCRRPELGAAEDPSHTPVPGDPYLTFRNPFVYFHSLLDGGACASDDLDEGALQGDLATPASTPSLSWIVPSACDDGSSTPCATGAAAGPGPADDFLKEVVPQILATGAYREAGLIAIVPDSPPASSPGSVAKPVGALLISPFVRSGARVSESFNDFSLLKSLTRLFGVLPLGHANDPSAVSFGATVYRTTK